MKNCVNILIFIILFFIACKKDKDENNTTNSGLKTQIDSYPLTIGNSWKYYTETHIIDSSGSDNIINSYDNFWTVISDTTINGIATSKISQLDSNYNGSIHKAFTYYSNRSDGFYGVAVENDGGLFFFRTTRLYRQTQFNLLGSFGDLNLNRDTVLIPDTALRLLKFPSNINDIWFSYEYNKPVPDVIKRKWVGNETITTSAGTFNCVKLQMFWDYDNNNQPDSGRSVVYQYFSTKGLIQEEWNDILSFGNGIDSLHRITKLVHLNF